MKTLRNLFLAAVVALTPLLTFGAANDIKISQSNSGGTAWIDRIFQPAGGTAITSVATLRTGLGLGTGDSPTFTAITLSGATPITLAGGGTITAASGSVSIVASGTNQNVTLTPSGTGIVSVSTKIRGGFTGSYIDVFNSSATLSANATLTLASNGGTAGITIDTSQDIYAANGGVAVQAARAAHAASTIWLDYSSGGRITTQGANGSTNGIFSLISQHSDGSGSITVLSSDTTGLITTAVSVMSSGGGFNAAGARTSQTASSVWLDYSLGARLTTQGANASTNGILTLLSQRSDGSNSITVLSTDTSGNVTLGADNFLARRSGIAFANGSGASAGTLTNSPAVGNPTKWIGVDDNGTTRYLPAW